MKTIKCLKCGCEIPIPPTPPPLECRDYFGLEYRKDGWGKLRRENGHKTNGIGLLLIILAFTILVCSAIIGLTVR